MKKIKCAKCGTENPEGSRFCSACGSIIILVDEQSVVPIEPHPKNKRSEFNGKYWKLMLVLCLVFIFAMTAFIMKPFNSSVNKQISKIGIEDGFAEIPWGTNAQAVSNIKAIDDGGKYSLYDATLDVKYLVSDIQPNRIRLSFAGKLGLVSGRVDIEDENSMTVLVEHLKKQFGEPKHDTINRVYSWKSGKRTEICLYLPSEKLRQKGLPGLQIIVYDTEHYKKAPITYEPIEAPTVAQSKMGIVSKLDASMQPVSFDVSFSSGKKYQIKIERNPHKFEYPLKVYFDGNLILQKNLVGEIGEVALARTRGSGFVEVVALLVGGNTGTLNDFCIIGDSGQGIEVLAEKNLFNLSFTRTKLVSFTDKIGIEYNPAGMRTRNQIGLVWNPEAKKYVMEAPKSIAPTSSIPMVDKTIFFSLKPEHKEVRYFIGDSNISEVQIRSGNKLLIRRDPTMNQELEMSYWNNYDEAIISPESVDGNFLITAIRVGKTKFTIFRPHNAPTGKELSIVVIP